jgi:arylsulfatase A-like enzyme
VQRTDTSIKRFEPSAELSEQDGWTIRAPSIEYGQVGDMPSLRLRGEELHYIEFPTDTESNRFDMVRIRLSTANELSVQAGLMHSGEALATSSDYGQVRAGEVSEFELELLDTHTGGWARGNLVLSVKGKELDWTLLSVELLRRPLESWLPRPEKPSGIEIGIESRRAFGLSTRSELIAECTLPENAHLSFAYSWARKLVPEDTRASLYLVVLDREGRPLGMELTLLSEQPGWSALELDLSGHAGVDVRIKLQLSTPSKGAAICAISEPAIHTTGAQAPTVLLVTSDTHRGDHARSDATTKLKTPTLDALAARGLRFDNCFVTSNITLPSHAALFTGSHPRDTGVINNSTSLAEDAPTLAESFHAAGYRTFGVAGAWHLRPGWSGFDQGFDRMTWPRGKNSLASDQLDALEAWLPDAEGQPLFVWLHLFDAHRPYEPPAPYDRMYYPSDRDPFVAAPDDIEFLPPPGQRGLRDIDFVFAQYKGEVSYLDAQLNRVLERERFGSATIALTSDHGESFGQDGVWWNHVGLFPEILHVPLILTWPAATGGRTSTTRVRQIDVGRTLLNLSGLENTPFPGSDLLDAARSEQVIPRFGLSDSGAEASLNLGPLHLVINLRERTKESDRPPGPFDLHRTQLFDTDADPDCLHDLSQQESSRARKLRETLVDWLKAKPSVTWSRSAESSEADREFLNDLGYASGDSESHGELFPESCACEHCESFR